MKRTLWIFVVCAFLGACASHPVQVAQRPIPTPAWFMTKENCEVWDPMPVAGETASWSGACVGGFVEGQGKLLWKVPYPALTDEGMSNSDLRVSSIFQGQMHHGFEQGVGLEVRFYPATGKTMYIANANYNNSQMEGPGTILNSRGRKYTGNFHLGRKEGHGVTEFPSGTRYDGNFADGLWEGHGRLTVSNGDTYDGEFHLGVPDGLGKFVKVRPGAPNSPQVVLDGSWQKGCFISQPPYACLTLIKP